MPVSHDFTSEVSDVGIPDGWVKPSNWNADHVLNGMLEQLDGVAPSPNAVLYMDANSEGSTFPISDYVRSVMNSASATALLAALNAAGLNSPAFTGTPTAPTTITSDNSTKLATTAFVQAVITALVGGSPALLDTLNELATALGNDPNFATTMTNALALKAPLLSPALTGTPTAPTAATGDATTKLATTAFVKTAVNRATALAASQDFNSVTTAGEYYTLDATPVNAPTVAYYSLRVETGTGLTITQWATLANATQTYIRDRDYTGAWSAWRQVAYLDSPAFTGNPTAPTPANGDNDTSIATTAFVQSALTGTLANGIAGLTLSTAGGSSSLTVAAGNAADSTNATMMKLAASKTKTTAAWVVGSGVGGLDTGAIAANTWYHWYEIERLDTGVVDVCFSTSASTPNLTTGNIPNAYTLFRRIGSAKTDGSSQWIAFTQVGDDFFWSTPVFETGAAITVGTARVLQALTVPTGVVVKALLNTFAANPTNISALWIGPQFSADLAPSIIGGAGGVSIYMPVINTTYTGGVNSLYTNTSSQIALRSDQASTAARLFTNGWTDTRGRLS